MSWLRLLVGWRRLMIRLIRFRLWTAGILWIFRIIIFRAGRMLLVGCSMLVWLYTCRLASGVEMLTTYFAHRGGTGAAMIFFGKLVMIFTRSCLMSHLCVGGWCMMFLHDFLFLRRRSCRGSTCAIKTGMTTISSCYAIVYISIMNHCSVYIRYRGIVPERMARPLTSTIAFTAIAIPIVHATVETYMRSPIAIVKAIATTFISPITWGP